jgi:hypothetical protein
VAQTLTVRGFFRPCLLGILLLCAFLVGHPADAADATDATDAIDAAASDAPIQTADKLASTI